ncbi:response regulator [Janthinobacterium sp.]|uniref:response regulator n=1 Tax=Janthinobacterium sp. TaxID=1871054 RepID=UPI0026151308|nr:response regulator [Janthinobacterium sp.]
MNANTESASAATAADDPDWLVDDTLPGSGEISDSAQAAAPWRVLIVDDDVDVHVVTKFALSQASFQGRRLSFLHAYSGAEALAVLRSTPDVAVVLLDVIMESQDAGLQVARRIREELHNSSVRIILRTGQPGQALEHRIILDYDINDFWCKTDLTTRKLFTTVISSLRTYASLREAQQQVAELEAALDQQADRH